MSRSSKRGNSLLPTSNPPPASGNHQDFAHFRNGIVTGDNHALLGPGLRRMLRGAAADPTLAPEIGAIRLCMVRLLAEETNPSRLALGIARLSAVAIQASRFRNSKDEGEGELRQAFARALEELDREEALLNGPNLALAPSREPPIEPASHAEYS